MKREDMRCSPNEAMEVMMTAAAASFSESGHERPAGGCVGRGLRKGD